MHLGIPSLLQPDSMHIHVQVQYIFACFVHRKDCWKCPDFSSRTSVFCSLSIPIIVRPGEGESVGRIVFISPMQCCWNSVKKHNFNTLMRLFYIVFPLFVNHLCIRAKQFMFWNSDYNKNLWKDFHHVMQQISLLNLIYTLITLLHHWANSPAVPKLFCRTLQLSRWTSVKRAITDGLPRSHPALFFSTLYITARLLVVTVLHPYQQPCVNTKLHSDANTRIHTLFTVAFETFPEE